MNSAPTCDFSIKAGYRARVSPIYFDAWENSSIDHQPDAYTLAGILGTHYGADSIVDIGCGSARKLMALEGFIKIGVDFGPNLDECRRRFPTETWLGIDFEKDTSLNIDSDTLKRSIVICADVIEHLIDPIPLLRILSDVSSVAAAVIITTPDRDLVRGPDDMGPPGNPAHVREWNTSEFESFLRQSNLNPSFIGLTVNNSRDLEKKTILAIIDHCPVNVRRFIPNIFRPLALMATFNDFDISPQVVAKYLSDGIDVHVLDNWSTDGTYEALESMAAKCQGLTLERFPIDGPSRYYEWRLLLQKKEAIALNYPGRWIIHCDSDEVRCSPWACISLREGLYIADQMGFNAVDFSVCDFRPIDKGFSAGLDPEKSFAYFEFGRRPGHFNQVKVWKQGPVRIDLASSGGHQALFPGRRDFPYKFILKHYSIRNPEQARRKIFEERRERFSPAERLVGWHSHYDNWQPEDKFLWDRNSLIEFSEKKTRRMYLTELIASVGIVR